MFEALKSALNLDGWQPMSTAPKDGTPVLLCEKGMVGMFYWGVHPELTHSMGGVPLEPDWIGVIIQSELNRSDVKQKIVTMIGSDATEWMPLPAGSVQSQAA